MRALLAAVLMTLATGCMAPLAGMVYPWEKPPERPSAPPPRRVRIDQDLLVPKAQPLPVGPDHFRQPDGWVTLGWSVEGRPIRCLLMGDGPDLYVVIGTIHGDEPVGAPLVRQLAKWLEGHPDLLKGKQVALIPIANPDGLVHGARLNVRGRDINRNWPSDNWIPGARRGPRPLSEPETRALFHLIGSRRPHRIITIHQPLVGVNWDGPAGRIARKIARVAGLRRLEMRERRGSIGTYAGRDRDIPVLTLELPQKAAEMRADQLWRRYGKALKWSISWPDPPPRAPPRQPSKNLSAAAVSNP